MSVSKHKKLLITTGVLLALVLCVAALLPLVVGSTNCGGNSAALAACKSVAVGFELVASDRNGKPVLVGDLNDSERRYFKQIAGLSWLGDAKVLVATELVSSDVREIVAVCDKPFDNVPRRLFGKAPLTHAVAYADGSSGLISIEEFQKLDLSKFVDVKSVQPANDNTSNGQGAASK